MAMSSAFLGNTDVDEADPPPQKKFIVDDDTRSEEVDLMLGSEGARLSSISDDEEKEKERRFLGRHVGLLMAVVSSLFFSLCSFIVRKVNIVGALEHSTMRFVGVLLPSVCLLASPIGGTSLRRTVVAETRGFRWTLLLRATLGSAGLMFQFYSFQHMPLADASALVFSSPVFVAVFARIFLGEPCGPTQATSVAITVVGVLLISRPPFLFGEADAAAAIAPGSSHLLGALSAVAGTACSANVYILLRKLKSIHFAVIMSSFAVVGVCMSHAGSLLVDRFSSSSAMSFCLPCSPAERAALLLLGAFSFCGQVLLTRALQLEQAGPVSVCRTTDIVFAFVLQVAFLDEVPDGLSVAGALLVTASVVVVGLRKWALELDRHSTLRRRLWFLVA